MLLVMFYLGKDPYALECSQVVEIVPKVLLKGRLLLFWRTT